VKELSFRNASLDTLPREVFAHADTLEHLDISGNHFTSLPDEFLRLRSLRRLFLSNNPCEELPRVIGQMPKLEMVVLKSCRLNRVAEDALPARLRWLTLTDNQLEFLPESLGHRPRLQKLALAGNRLRALPSSMSNATALELIRVSANALEEFPRALLTLPWLAWFAWAGNPFCTRPDVTAQILWSLDVETWHSSGATEGGLTVTLTTAVVSPPAEDPETVEVTANLTGPGATALPVVFFSLQVTP
jgi:Leucine-rich repeat (LRR) protein